MTARLIRDDSAGRSEAIDVLRRGGLVGLPTDTVYGMAVALQAPDAIERLFAAKGRPPDKAIVLLVADIGQAERTGLFGPAARALAAAAWPGALTLVVAQRPEARLPASLTAGGATIGLRSAGSRHAPGPGPGPRPVAGHLGESLGRAGSHQRCGCRDRAGRRARADPRWRPNRGQLPFDRRPLRWLGDGDPAGWRASRRPDRPDRDRGPDRDRRRGRRTARAPWRPMGRRLIRAGRRMAQAGYDPARAWTKLHQGAAA